jgi:pimeloyl-ACP methyl ester carboxylesterase
LLVKKLFAPPSVLAGGDGWQYSLVADILADQYKVITYDRRANARSTINVPQNFEISQQSHDAVAVLRAAGETSAFVIGNSSGAVIGLDMAKTQPQAAQMLAEQLGCELVTFPGHHGSFMDMLVEWAATLRGVLHKAEK